PANNAKMYIAGVFNSWGADEMELVAANTWEIKNIDLAGGAFKFKNTTDWSDADWGDAGCDGVVEVTTGGGPNTDCKFSGLVNVTFNDETLKYTVVPAVAYNTNLESLFLLGTFNDFTGPQPQFKLVADYTWVIDEFRLSDGDVLRFVEHTNFEGGNYGASGVEGKAKQYGENIELAGYEDGYYKITFNDATLKYEFELVRNLYPSALYLVGDATPAGWDNNSKVSLFRNPSNGFKFSYTGKFSAGSFKILEKRGQWQPQYGKGANAGDLAVNEGSGSDPDVIQIAAAGYYTVSLDLESMKYSVVAYDASSAPTYTSIGITGSAIPGASDPDIDMVKDANDPHQWYIETQELTAAAGNYVKFRANDSWTVNWGGSTFPYGDGAQDGANISVTRAGTFLIHFNDLTGEYAFIKK
ncbi:MAG TPA: SusF/SusE family outer membrane protein, partial [Ohtaekwangia sp.]|uniref:SusF/SusE family outer membrane protein n=1 Tax=Ohtaekwangia sp. TaxID=2066019 RepID=UPI002F946D08